MINSRPFSAGPRKTENRVKFMKILIQKNLSESGQPTNPNPFEFSKQTLRFLYKKLFKLSHRLNIRNFFSTRHFSLLYLIICRNSNL